MRRVEVSLVLSMLLMQGIASAQTETCTPPGDVKAKEVTEGQVSKDQTCTVTGTVTVGKNELKNSGTIILESGASIKFTNGKTLSDNTISIVTSENSDRGKFELKGDASIISANGSSRGADLKIEGQDFTLVGGRTLVFQAGGNNGAGQKDGDQPSLTFGESGKNVTFFNPDSGNYSKIVTKGFVTLQNKDVSFTNTSLVSEDLKTLKNTKTVLNNASISTSQDLTITNQNGNGNNSTFAITHKSLIHSSSKITLSGGVTHSFSGSGILDFQADKGGITLGNGSQPPQDSTLTLTLKKDGTTRENKDEDLRIGLKGSVKIMNLKVEGLKLEALSDQKSTIENKKLELGDMSLSAMSFKRENQQALEIKNEESNKSADYGEIIITEGKAATLLGSGIEIYGQTIKVGNGASQMGINTGGSKTKLILESDSSKGGIILGRMDSKENVSVAGLDTNGGTGCKDGAVSIMGKANGTNASELYLNATKTTFGVLTLGDLSVFARTKAENTGVVLSGDGENAILNFGSDKTGMTAENASTAQSSTGTLLLSTGDETGANYQDLTITNVQFKGNSKINVNQNTTIKASSLSIQNQTIAIKPTAQKEKNTPSTLTLYALGKDGKTDIGNFAFKDTSISNGSNAEVKLMSNGGAKLRAVNLTLEGVKFTSNKAETGAQRNANEMTSLDLSARGDSINVLGTTSIEAKGVLTTGGKNGFGMDIRVGDATKTGQLTIKDTSTYQSSDPSFLIDGSLTLDNTKGTNGKPLSGAANHTSFDIQAGDSTTPMFDIEAGVANGVNGQGRETSSFKLSTQTLGLEVQGGIKAIGTTSNKVEVKAKKFTFGDQSYVHVQNTELTLNIKDGEPIKLKGVTSLDGTAENEAKLVSKKTNGNSSRNNTVAGLELYDVISRGKASITDKLTFKDSNIYVEGRGSGAKSLTLVNKQNGDGGKMSGIASIALRDADIIFQKNGASSMGLVSASNGATSAEVEMTAGALITSSGVSTLEAKALKNASGLEKAEGSGITLKVLDGTFTLKEETTENALGEIILGSQDKGETKAGNLVLLKNGGATKGKQTPTYNEFKLKGNLTSYGDSSITASSFMLGVNGENGASVFNTENPLSITSNDGELKIIKDSTAQMQTQTNGDSLSLKVNLNLNHGSFGYYTKPAQSRTSEATLGSLKLESRVKVTSTGDSKINAKTLTLNDNDFHITGGTLTLTGVQDTPQNSVASLAPQTQQPESNKMGNLYVGNAGSLYVLSSGETQSTLSLKKDASITLGAKVDYVSPSEPLGSGKFGTVFAKEVIFGGDSTEGQKLINIVINPPQETPSQKLNNDSLFALREGEVPLITTQEGIKKTKNTTPESTEAMQDSTSSTNGKVDITLEDITLDKDRFSSLTLTPILKTAEKAKGEKFVKDLVLSLKVSQTNAHELLESIKKPSDQEAMKDLIQSPHNATIIDSILQDPQNPLRLGLAEYISSGNVGVMQDALDKIKTTFSNLAGSLYVNDKIYEELLMIRQSNFESRRVRASNPFAPQEEIASLLQKASRYRYASAEENLFFVNADPNPYHQIWATYDGAIDVGSAQKSSVNGLSAGYDLLLGGEKEYLFGVFMSYGYGTYSTSSLQDTSHNIGFGAYSRMFFGSHEVDASLSQTIGLRTLQSDIRDSNSTLATILNQSLDYTSYATDLQFSYGYTFKVGAEENPYYLKPFGGVGLAFLHHTGGQGDGLASIGIESSTQYRIDFSLGMEMRKYLNASTYFYLLPLLEVNALNTGEGVQIGFNTNRILSYARPQNHILNLGLFAGGQGSITDQLSISGGFGAKASLNQKDVLTNWNVGLRYKF